MIKKPQVKNLFVIVVLFFSTLVVAQQSGDIKGTITDNEMSGEPLLFANIVLKNTTFKTQSNFHGNFEIADVAPGEYIMEVSYLGYENMEFPVVVEADKITFLKKGMGAITINPNIHVMEAETSNPSTANLRVSRDKE